MKRTKLVSTTIPYLFVAGFIICFILFGNEILELSRHSAFFVFPKGYVILGMIGIILFLEVVYWLFKKTGYRLLSWLIYLHWAITLSSMGFFLAAIILFRQNSILGTNSLLELNPAVVSYPALTRPAFYFVVGQYVLILNMLTAIMMRRKRVVGNA